MTKRLFTPEESHTLHETRHHDGVLTIRFRDYKSGGPGKFEYDYPDPEGKMHAAIHAAERPGTMARSLIKAGTLVHSVKRDMSAPEGTVAA